MSNARTKAQRSKAKDARQMPAEDPGKHPSKRKRDKPCVVECRRVTDTPMLQFVGLEWRPWGRYHSMDVAMTALELAKSKYRFYEFRIGDDDGSR